MRLRAYQRFMGLLLTIFASYASAQSYWPTEGWRASTPEEQGVDSARLAPLVEFVAQSEARAHSLLVIRNGYIITEVDFYPYRADVPHVLQSVTKSVTSALIGAAIEQGSIRNVDRPVLEFFQNRSVANLSPRKRAMKLRHLLKMTSGLRWSEVPYGSPDTTFGQMEASDDWVQFLLELPMASAPGRSFNYSSGDSHLLSAVLQEATDNSPLDFAQESLFRPLGITRVKWLADPAGTHVGGFGLLLTPRDLAKIGYLYLQRGVWNGKRLFPERWTEVSTKAQVAAPSYGSMYGYQWWVDAKGIPAARGTGGQEMILIPDLDLIAVITANDLEALPLGTLLSMFMPLDSLSKEPLPDNPGGHASLQMQIRRAELPDAKPTGLPAVAQQISEKVYRLEDGSDYDTLSLRFTKDEARLLLTYPGGGEERVMALGTTYRFMRVGETQVALRGYWRDGHTFVTEQKALDGEFSSTMFLTFREKNINVFVESSAQVVWTQRMTGHLQE